MKPQVTEKGRRPDPSEAADPVKLSKQIEDDLLQMQWSVEFGERLIETLHNRSSLPYEAKARVDAGICSLLDQFHLRLRQIQGYMAIFQPALTEFCRLAIISIAPKIRGLKQRIESLIAKFSEVPEWPEGHAFFGPETVSWGKISIAHNYPPDLGKDGQKVSFHAASVGESRATAAALSRVESVSGSFRICAKNPKIETARALVRAGQNGEEDFERFIEWFCGHELHVRKIWISRDKRSVSAAPYIASVIFGLRSKWVNGASELFLPGDVTIVRHFKEINLIESASNDTDFAKELVRAAKSRAIYEDSGTDNRRFLGRVTFDKRADPDGPQSMAVFATSDFKSYRDLRRSFRQGPVMHYVSEGKQLEPPIQVQDGSVVVYRVRTAQPRRPPTRPCDEMPRVPFRPPLAGELTISMTASPPPVPPVKSTGQSRETQRRKKRHSKHRSASIKCKICHAPGCTTCQKWRAEARRQASKDALKARRERDSTKLGAITAEVQYSCATLELFQDGNGVWDFGPRWLPLRPHPESERLAREREINRRRIDVSFR